MSHTPGPWEAFGAGVYAKNCCIVHGSHNTRAADSLEEKESNALLTAAAPEMEEALADVLAWFVDAEAETGKPLGEGLGYRAKMQLPVLVAKIKAALDKAEGLAQ